MVKNPPAVQEPPETWVRSLSQEDPLEEGHGNPLHILGLENSTDRGTWQATVHRVAKSQAERSNPMFKEQWLRGRRRAKTSYSKFKVRRGGCEEIPLVQGKEQQLRFAGAAVKR